MRLPDVTVVGAGPAGLMAAEVLASGGCAVTVIDGMASPARKFLLAGRGGLNLTHSEPLDEFVMRYGEARHLLEPAIRAFPPEALRGWCHGLGIETFVGSSGRVFPVTMKASPLLRAWLRRLAGLGVTFRLRTDWRGPLAAPCVLAMGGASWPKLGSDARWIPVLAAAGVEIVPFRPANGRFRVAWSEHFAVRFAGMPVKNVALHYRGHSARGEIMIAKNGIEGGAIYALSRWLRDEPGAPLIVDLRPDLSPEAVALKWQRRKPKESQANALRRLFGLAPPAIGLLRETGATSLKAVPVSIGEPDGLERAISSAGGIALGEVDGCFELRKLPGIFAVGEMLDWEAPTGGYLLQACMSSSVMAARSLLSRYEAAPAPSVP